MNLCGAMLIAITLAMTGAIASGAVDSSSVKVGSRSATQDSVTIRFSAKRTKAVRDTITNRITKLYEGDVRFERSPQEWARSRTAEYSAYHRMARMDGGVTFMDSGRVMTAPRVTYLFRDHPRAGGRPMMTMDGGVIARDSVRTVRADRVTYLTEGDSIFASGGVGATSDSGFVSADSLVIDARTGAMEGFGSVRIVDSTQNALITGGWFRSRDSVGVISRSPVLRLGRGDTAVVVRADSMMLDQRSHRAVAWDSVRITRGSLRAGCDSVEYDEKREHLRLFGLPWATQRTTTDTSITDSRLRGTTMTLALKGTTVESIIVEGRAHGIATETDSTGSSAGERWIAGKRITFHIRGERVTSIDVQGQARSRYAPADADREGTNVASGDTMVIGFRGGRVATVEIRGGVQGVFRPPADSTAKMPDRMEKPRGGARDDR
jgi:lipopolysaccharide export system protein LptA